MWFMNIPVSICLCKRVAVQCVNTLNYYGGRMKFPTLLRNVCNVVVVTPGRVQRNWGGGLCTGQAIYKQSPNLFPSHHLLDRNVLSTIILLPCRCLFLFCLLSYIVKFMTSSCKLGQFI